MRADELSRIIPMREHEENGLFKVTDYVSAEEGRASSGSIYYYLAAKDLSAFHQIDCDEYWCYHEGTTLEIWIVDENHRLSIRKLGTAKGSEPTVFIPKGSIFAARHGYNRSDGTFVSCITVPRYEESKAKLFTKEEMIGICPATVEFWHAPRPSFAD